MCSALSDVRAERAIAPGNELAAYGVGCSEYRDLTLGRRKSGHAFQPGMA
jgi:hypothetical protein